MRAAAPFRTAAIPKSQMAPIADHIKRLAGGAAHADMKASSSLVYCSNVYSLLTQGVERKTPAGRAPSGVLLFLRKQKSPHEAGLVVQ